MTKASSSNATSAIAVIGGGKMGSALVKGIIRAGVAAAKQIWVAEPADALRNALAKETGVNVTADNVAAAKNACVVILAVKPDVVPAALAQIKPVFTKNHLLLSIAAGITLAKLETALPAGARVIRVMPNTPSLVGAGAAGFALGSAATAADAMLAQRILGAVGLAFQLPERLLDAVTGLSGSGPAYIYMVIESLSDGGVAMGLPRDVATRLAAQTVLGAAKMVLDTGLHPGVLKDQVTSPGGTTIEGIHALETGSLRATFMRAVKAATEKSKLLGAK
ncbi:MAG: pyrroline-5-carboxylate reductase [Verrucomicrobia bacterium]|nr:pyrroline-5-carboxylate reductase [Verrucomicrobiota bacterium]